MPQFQQTNYHLQRTLSWQLTYIIGRNIEIHHCGRIFMAIFRWWVSITHGSNIYIYACRSFMNHDKIHAKVYQLRMIVWCFSMCMEVTQSLLDSFPSNALNSTINWLVDSYSLLQQTITWEWGICGAFQVRAALNTETRLQVSWAW